MKGFSKSGGYLLIMLGVRIIRLRVRVKVKIEVRIRVRVRD